MKANIKRNTFKGVLLLALTLIMLFGVFLGSPLTASAATSTSATLTTSGSYDVGDGSVSGYMSNYKIYMHSSSTNGSTGTAYNGRVLNWNYVYIKIDATDINSHTSFKLTRNGSTYVSKSLSGSSDMTLYSGSLPDGEYVLTYKGKHNTFLWVTADYTYTYKFVIDKTGPTYTLKAGTTSKSSGSYVNQQITYSVSDYKTWCIYYKKPGYSSYSISYNDTYTVAATAANNGWWYFYAEDYYYNTNSVVSIYLDTIAPVGKVTNSSGSTISNGGYTNKPIKYTATDTGGVSYYQVKKPGSTSWASYTSGTSLSSSYGWYTFRAVDKAGNISDEYKVYYDAGVPTGTLYGGTSSKSSGSYTNASYIKYTASDSYSGIANCYVKMPGASYYTAYSSGTQLATEGTYYFYSVDKSGNQSSIVSITLDKTKPTGTLYGGSSVISNGGSTNASSIKFVPYDAIGLSATYVKKPGSSTYVAYTSGTQFTTEGTYSFYSVDKAGNQSSVYTITLDRQIPSAQLYVDDQPIDNNGYTNGAHIKFECGETCYVQTPDSDMFVSYASGSEFYKAGKYVFYGVDSAGNSTGYYTIVIDRTSKPLDLSGLIDGTANGDVVISWTDGDANVYAPVVSVTINGKSYTKGETVYTIDTGVYKVVCTDAAGNVWETEFVSAKQNVITETLQKEYYEAPDAEGEFYSFATYDSAFAFAVEREKSFVRTGTWNNETWDTGIAMDATDAANAANGTYFIYKKSGNPDEEVAYFTEARLNEVIAEYAAIGIVDYYFWEKEPATIADGENLFSYSDTKTILADSIIFGENIGIVIDGEDFVGTVYEGEGKHLVTVTDSWGNSCDYNVIVIRRTPDIHYAIGEGSSNIVTFDRTYFFKDQITVSIADEFDEMAMFNVYDENGDLLGNFSLGETFTLSASGSYTVESVNHFGTSETFEIIISRDAPKVTITENADEKKLEINITASSDKESHIQTLEIYKSNDNGETWTLVEKDDYGNTVSLDKLSYAFRTSGMYKVVVTDEFRTGIDAVTEQITYVQPNPLGALEGVENGGYTNGTVSFVWTDEAVVTLEKDGEIVAYESGDKLTEDGVYKITFENFDGYTATYTFTIDTAKPVVVVSGAENGRTVSANVKATISEAGLDVELFKDGNSLGAYVSDTVISESGSYTLVVTDLANNKTEVSFEIDKFVDFAINVNENGLSNSVTATANEDVSIVFTKDGEAAEYTLGDAITVPGKYTLALTDKLGNKTEISFEIVQPLVKEFTCNFDNTPGFEKALVNGEEKRLNYGTLELFEDGTYEVGAVVNGKTYNFVVTVDGTAPTLTLSGVENGGATKGAVVLSDMSETADMKVYKNDVEISYNLGDELTEEGVYKVVLTDDCGNVTEYTFEILHSMNGGAIALIIIGVLLVAGVIVLVVIMRKKGKFGKSKR
ncbi:MAG: hypothetical protein IJX81_02515 [Clostridia bacterium]|nr:hypothetical protein [Clostridia bacterium]